MAKVFKVLSACGSGIATSSHVATSIRQGMADRGVNVEVRTCGVNEMSGLIDNVKPTIIVSTTSLESVRNEGEIKVMSGVPLLTGIGKNQFFDEMEEYLKSIS